MNLNQKKSNQSEFHFLFNDATTFQIPENTSVFYFFNPFGKDIIQKVIQNIKESLKQNPRKIYCIYLNPKYKSVFDHSGFKQFCEIKNKRYLEGIIYIN